MRPHHFLSCLFAIVLAACIPVTTPVPEMQMVSVYTTLSTRVWLTEVYDCTPSETLIRVADDPVSADISLRLGEPDIFTTSAYQIDTEEILVVTHRQSPVQNMSVAEVRELFAGGSDGSVQVWVYAAGEDVQMVFEQAVMRGRSVTSLARLATSPQHMSDTLNNQPNTVGILPRRWKAGDSRFVYTISDVPVLAILKEDPHGVVQKILSCMQK